MLQMNKKYLTAFGAIAKGGAAVPAKSRRHRVTQVDPVLFTRYHAIGRPLIIEQFTI